MSGAPTTKSFLIFSGLRSLNALRNVERLDLAAGTLRLEPGTMKNREGRTVYLTPELIPLLADQIERVKALSRKLNRVVPYLFPNPRKGRFQGSRLRDFRKSWLTRLQERRTHGDAAAQFSTKRREKFGALGG